MKTLLLTACIAFSLNTTAQISFVPTEYIDFEPVSYYSTSDGGFITLKKINRALPGRNWNRYRYKLSIVKYDKEMKLVKEQAISNGDEDFSTFYADLKLSGNTCWLICTDPAEENAIGNIKAIEIDPLSLQPGTPKVLATKIQIDAQLNLYGGYTSRKIVFESSSGLKHHFLFVGNDKDEFYLSGMNEQLTTLWKGKRALADIKQKDIRSIKIDDNGNIFISAVNKTGGFVIKYDAEGKPMYKTVSLGEDQPGDVQLHISKTTGQVFVAGTYLPGSDYASGVYYATVSKNSFAIENIHKTIFPESIITRLKKDGFGNTRAKNYGIFSSYTSSRLYGKPGDKLNLVIECKHELGDRSALGAGSLVIVNFDAANSNFAHIPRYAVSAGSKTDDRFYAVTCDQQLILFYLDHEANLNKDLGDAHTVLKGNRNAILTAASIDNTGSTIKKAVELKDMVDLWGSINFFLKKECKK